MANGEKHGDTTFRLPGIRTFEMIQYVSGWPESFPEDGFGSMADLPTNLQDRIGYEMELLSLRVALPLAVVFVRMDTDVDRQPDDPRGFVFLQVILSEIVMLDTARLLASQQIGRTMH